MSDNDLVNLAVLARRLKLPRNLVAKLAKDREIPCWKAGRRLLFCESAVRQRLAGLAATHYLPQYKRPAGERGGQ